MIQVLDCVPEGIVQRPGRIWNVFARSLGEQGASGRTALAWRWALTGSCPSPVTLSAPAGGLPDRGEILAEAGAVAELGGDGSDPGGQVMHARFVLQWLAGDLEALPLWNVGPQNPHVTDGADYARARAEIEEAYGWTLAARLRYPWPGESAPDGAWLGFGWAFGAMQLLAWACGEAEEGPVSGMRVAGRPSLYQVSLDVRRAMTALHTCARGWAADRDRPPGGGHGNVLVAGGVEPAATGRPARPWLVRGLPGTGDAMPVWRFRRVPSRAMPGLLACQLRRRQCGKRAGR